MSYTSHGHWVGSGDPTGPPPPLVARCGGPGLCGPCSQEAATAGFYGGDPKEESAVRMTEAWDPSQHPRAPAGSSAGGQFKPMSYDKAKDHGTGYGKKGGDANVRKLQQALNRLGLVDKNGDRLKVDGMLGPLTTSSVKSAQRRLGLPATGKVTPELLAKLTRAKSLPAAAKGKAPAEGKGKKPDAKKKAAVKKKPVKKKPPVKALQPKPYRYEGTREAAEQKAIEQAVEAHVNGAMSFSDVSEAVRKALRRRLATETGKSYAYVYVVDLTTTDAVYERESGGLFQCSYTITEGGQVTLGEPETVVRTYMPQPNAPADPGDGGYFEPVASMESELVEERDRIEGRVVEAKGTDDDGGRIFRVRVIKYGESKNRRNYPEQVMRAAVPMYEGARAYDHHRTDDELRTSTINGLIGSYRNVEAAADGIYADLHLLPGAVHAAESLDASLAAQGAGLPPLIGVSHDVMATYRSRTSGGRRKQEATQIVKVNSADLVADPAAGGVATRMVAGGEEAAQEPESGTGPAEMEEGDVPVKKEDVLGVLAEATDEELAAVGLTRALEADEDPDDVEDDVEEETTEATEAVEEEYARDGAIGRLLIAQKVTEAELPPATAEALTKALPARITEADIDGQIHAMKAWMGDVERMGLAPTATVQVTQEARDKKVQALDAFFEGRYSEGYRSFRQAFTDFTGRQPKAFDEDYNRVMLRESMGVYDSAARSTESMDSATWAQVLGDSVTRRLVAMYQVPSLQTWRQIVSATPPINDFRTQRIGRVGGYGTLPAVNQGAPYQPLDSPTDEEATYAVTKRGGTEDLTLEMIANDDIRAIAGIPTKLGRAAAQTLYRFVWNFLNSNVTCTYDSVALFHADHDNDDVSDNALSESALNAARLAMRTQAAYGDDDELLDNTPQLLVVPPNLETMAYKLTRSAVAVTSGEDATTPNIHNTMGYVVVPYFAATSTNRWFAVADRNAVPTIEVGFYQGRENPELFTQNDPSIGSMFDADKITYKIRHIYSGTVLDHRGFYRGGTA